MFSMDEAQARLKIGEAEAEATFQTLAQLGMFLGVFGQDDQLTPQGLMIALDAIDAGEGEGLNLP